MIMIMSMRGNGIFLSSAEAQDTLQETKGHHHVFNNSPRKRMHQKGEVERII